MIAGIRGEVFSEQARIRGRDLPAEIACLVDWQYDSGFLSGPGVGVQNRFQIGGLLGECASSTDSMICGIS